MKMAIETSVKARCRELPALTHDVIYQKQSFR